MYFGMVVSLSRVVADTTVRVMAVARARDGATIAYDVTGDGPPLVLVHGITDCRRLWDPLVPAFAVDHRVIAVDLRGHGESARLPPYDPFTMADDLEAVIADTDAGADNPPLLVGHSLGGIVVTMYLAGHTARGVVNVDQPLEISGFKTMLTSVEPMLRGDEASFHAVLDGLFEALFGPLDESERARVRAEASPEQDVVLGVWDLALTMDADALDAMISDGLRDVRVPYLTILGNEPGDYASWLTNAMPHAVIDVWPGTGHFLQLVDKERFVQRVRDFEGTLP
jgi:pimeloyl-ACP methyl ester carboxylesterase